MYYYRKGSAASRLTPSDLDEDYITKAKYMHIMGITPALSVSCQETIFSAIAMACRHGVKIVFDPNLRLKLWQEDRAKEVMFRIATQADIALLGIAEAVFLFGAQPLEELGKLFLNNGASLVVLKLGAKGAHYFTIKRIGLFPDFWWNKSSIRLERATDLRPD
ncbi:sugar/nucleoside kinase (ribokinase family) [Anoxybacillus tepidamans]|uniref:Sugar/nucleoside kinase (Ribokinase family) n=1 Tax=Anoxybacteroides tepidamans TaxID=265948 RepID=A0A7W8MVE1_9BACL|nr:sugar/nucleoside kinase (ribokinase family) [Anoxybacillus tepidamans]